MCIAWLNACSLFYVRLLRILASVSVLRRADVSGSVHWRLEDTVYNRLFKDAIQQVSRAARPTNHLPRRIRLLGELPDILAQRGLLEQAIELEKLWNVTCSGRQFLTL